MGESKFGRKMVENACCIRLFDSIAYLSFTDSGAFLIFVDRYAILLVIIVAWTHTACADRCRLIQTEGKALAHFAFNTQAEDKHYEGYKLLHSGDGSLVLRKLNLLFPVMLLNYISIMVMTSVDSIVVGWGIGEKAVASVNYFQPFDFVMGALVTLVSNGVATLMSKQLGANDPEGMARNKKAVLYSTLLLAFILSIIQIPICLTMFRLYNMEDAVYNMALRYAVINMIATPFSIMNTIGTYLLTSIGRAKTVLKASLLQSGVNVVLDVLFVFGFGMSTDGAGLGTLCATMVYMGYVLNHLIRHSEFLKIDRGVDCRKELVEIVKYGAPSMNTALSDALFSSAIFWFISQKLSDTGIAIHSVCLFAGSFITIIILSLRSAMQSVTGMLSTIGDTEGMHRLLKRAIALCMASCGCVGLLVEICPSLFFRAYGYSEIPELGIAALRVYALSFFFSGANSLLRLYFNNWDDVKFATIHGSLNSIIMPAIFAGVFFLFGAPWTLWLCYVVTDVLCLVVALERYLRKYRSVQSNPSPNDFNIITHPDEAPQAAAQLEHILLENGISRSLAFRVALCVEEIGAYAVPVKGNREVTIQLYAYVSEEGDTTIIMLDDGQCVAFPEDNHQSVLATTNYEMLKRIANESAYDFVLDLNRFTIKLRGAVQKGL